MRTYVLVPGAGGSARYWHRLVPLLRDAGHAAVAVALPAGDDTAGLAAYAEAIVAAARGASEVVLVAQSMGGLSAPLAVDRLGARGIVLVNAMIPAPGETGGQWWDVTGQDAARRARDLREGRDPDAPFDPAAVFLHDVPADVAEAAGDPGPQSGTPFGEPWPSPRWPDLPTRVLAGEDDRLFPPEFQERVARERLGLPVRRIPGGHLVALSRPAELAAALLAG